MVAKKLAPKIRIKPPAAPPTPAAAVPKTAPPSPRPPTAQQPQQAFRITRNDPRRSAQEATESPAPAT
eukprot:53166-Eustigmatos_ZCMA.PRE.1